MIPSLKMGWMGSWKLASVGVVEGCNFAEVVGMHFEADG